MRCACITLTRRNCRPSARSRNVRPPINAACASSALNSGLSALMAAAAHAGVTTRPIMRSPWSVCRRYTRGISVGRRFQTGSRSPATICSVLSWKGGVSRISRRQAVENAFSSISCQWLSSSAATDKFWFSMGRNNRIRRSIAPSSSISEGAGICTAARPERSLTRSFPL